MAPAPCLVRQPGRRAFFAAGLALLVTLSGAPPTRAAGKDRKGAASAEVTFTGFRDLGGGRALVFVELSERVEVSVSQRGDEVIYELKGAQVPLRNNQNPLVTSAFASNLLSARLTPSRAGKRKKGRDTNGVQLILKLRRPVSPTFSFVDRAHGVAFEVTIPAT